MSKVRRCSRCSLEMDYTFFSADGRLKGRDFWKCDQNHLEMLPKDGKCAECESELDSVGSCTDGACVTVQAHILFLPGPKKPEEEPGADSGDPDEGSTKSEAATDEDSADSSDDSSSTDDSEEEDEGLVPVKIDNSDVVILRQGEAKKSESPVNSGGFECILKELRAISLKGDVFVVRRAQKLACLIKDDQALESLRSVDPDFYLKIKDLISGETLMVKEAQASFNRAVERGIDFSVLSEEITCDLALIRKEHLQTVLRDGQFRDFQGILFEGHVQRVVLEGIYFGSELRDAKAREKKEKEMENEEREKKEAAAAARPPEPSEAQIETLRLFEEIGGDVDATVDEEELARRQVCANELLNGSAHDRAFRSMCRAGQFDLDMQTLAKVNAIKNGSELRRWKREQDALFEKEEKEKGEREAQELLEQRKAGLLELFERFERAHSTPISLREAKLRQRLAQEALSSFREMLDDRSILTLSQKLALRASDEGDEIAEVQEQLQVEEEAEKLATERAEKAASEAEKPQEEEKKTKAEKDSRLSKRSGTAGTGISVGTLVFLVKLIFGFSATVAGAGILIVAAGIAFLLAALLKNVVARFVATGASAVPLLGAIALLSMVNSPKKAVDVQPNRAGYDRGREWTSTGRRTNSSLQRHNRQNAKNYRRPSSRKGPLSCKELIKKAGGSTNGGIVRIVGCEKKGVFVANLPPTKLLVLRYKKGGVLLNQGAVRWARTLIKERSPSPCGKPCRLSTQPRESIVILVDNKASAFIRYKATGKLWWFVVNKTQKLQKIQILYNGPWRQGDGLRGGKVESLQLEKKIFSASEYARLERERIQ